MSGPKRGRKGKAGKSSLSRVSNASNGCAGGEDIEEILFDGDDGREEEGSGEDEEKSLVGESRSRA